MTSKAWMLPIALGALAISAGFGLAQTPARAPASVLATGAAVFEARCKTCHEPSIENAPERPELAKRPKAEIVEALTSGLMVQNATGLTPAEIDAVATYLTTPTGAPVAGKAPS